MSEVQSSNEEAQPQQDPTIEKIDELLRLLMRWRQLIEAIGDPRAAASEAMARVRELRSIVRTAPTPQMLVAAVEVPWACARSDSLTLAAADREEIDRAVERLRGAVADSEPSAGELRDRVDRYLSTMVDHQREDGDVFTPDAAANRFIVGLTRRWPDYGRKLEPHRADLIDRMAKLKVARQRGAPSKGERTHYARSAAELREEILRWVGLHGTKNAVSVFRSRKGEKKRPNK